MSKHCSCCCASPLAAFDTPPPSCSWGNRRANGYQALAEDGYALLAERLRSEEERAVVRSVLERVLHVKLDMVAVYAADAAAAQDALQAAMLGNAANEETVRFGDLLCLSLGSVCGLRAPPPLSVPANAMRTTGLNHNMWRIPK